MNRAERYQLPELKYFTRGTILLAAVAFLGLLAYAFRFIFGLEAATNLTNHYPWGIWIAIDVASGVALAAGGFTTAAIVYVFRRGRYHRFIRPALLTAMLGYTFVVLGLLADLGRYYNVWHPILPGMWQTNSVLFEVGMCVMIYLSVLYIEFIPIAIERFKGKVNLPGFLGSFNSFSERLLSAGQRFLKRYIVIFIIAGIVLSFLHQSSLGTLMLIAPQKMNPLWNSPISPLLFLLSAIAVGFPMVIFEAILSERSFKLKSAIKDLSAISIFVPVLLGIYLAVRIVDITIRGVWSYVIDGSFESLMFIIEVGLGVLAPIIILSIGSLRGKLRWLFIASSATIIGVLLNRINVFIVAYNPLYSVKPYFPSPFEIMVTVGLVACLMLMFRLIALNFPILSDSADTLSVPELGDKEISEQFELQDRR